MKTMIKQKMLETKTKIVLDAISDYFEKVGFSDLKMNDIARAIGVSVGALYKLFPSKDELFFAYVEYQINKFYEILIKGCENMDNPRDRLVFYIKTKFDTFVSKRKAIEDPVIGDPLFFVKMNTKKKNPAQPIFRFLASQFEEISKITPLKNSDFMKTAYLFNGDTMGYIEYWLNFGGELENNAERVFEQFMRGIEE